MYLSEELRAAGYHSMQEIIDRPADGRRYEVVWGELLVTSMVSLPHQRALTQVAFPVSKYCDRFDLGETILGPADISWGPDTLVKPDVFVVPRSELGSDDWSTVQTLRFVAEVLSPETARHDRFRKRVLYQMQEVEMLWLIDIDRRYVEVWTPDALFPVIEIERVTWHAAGATEPLVIDVAELLSDT